MTEKIVVVDIPTFISPYLFWIVEKKCLFIRAAMEQLTKKDKNHKKIDVLDPNSKQMILVNVDGIWARARPDRVINKDNDVYYLCWLCDYGIMRVVKQLYYLPDYLKDTPEIAKQACLENVVNLTSDFVIGNQGYQFCQRKTIDHVEGVTKVIIERLKKAKELHFVCIREDKYNIYGDIVCDDSNTSLICDLVDKNLMVVDEKLFCSIEPSRSALKKSYFQHSSSWQQPVDKYVRPGKEVIYNEEINKLHYMEFFTRGRPRNP